MHRSLSEKCSKCLAARLVVLLAGAYVANSLLDVVGQLELFVLDKVLALLLRLDRVKLRLGLDFCPLSREVGRVHVSVRQKDRNAVFRLPTHGLEFLHKGTEAVPLFLHVRPRCRISTSHSRSGISAQRHRSRSSVSAQR